MGVCWGKRGPHANFSPLGTYRYSSVLDCVQKTYKHEGFSGFFRGLWIPLITITAVRTASFSIYTGCVASLSCWKFTDVLDRVKHGLQERHVFTSQSFVSTAALGFSGGASSGMLLSLGTSAFEYIKISQQLEYLLCLKRGVPFEPKGTISGFVEVGFSSI